MGDIVILLHEDDLHDYLPANTHRIFISGIKQSTDSSTIFIRSSVKKRWPTQKTRHGSLLKVVLADGEHDADSINVYFMGDLADQSGVIDVGDTVLLSNFFIENSTNPVLSTHSCQLVLDKRRSSPAICILLRQRQQQQQSQQQQPAPIVDDPISDPVPSTSRQTNQKEQQTTSRTVTTTSSVTTATSSATARPAIQGQGPRVSTSYTYKKLKELVKDTVVHVYGIVKFVKQPFRTRGTDYMMLVSIVDSSLDSLSDKLKCVLFAREQNMFPAQAEVGDIIRMHRLKISEFNGELQGKNGPGFSFLLFSNGDNASLAPKFTSAHHYTITEDDYNQVTELRTWWSSLQLQDPEEETPLPRSLSLADVQCGSYFDLTCQVIGVCSMSPREGCLLKVWDGTRAIVPVYDVETGEHEVQYDKELARKAADYIVDVCVFDNHFERGSYCQPGNFVKFYNLHAMKHKVTAPEEQHSAVPMVELCLHGGTSYGRGMRIFNETDKQVEGLKKRLENIKTRTNSSLEENQLTPSHTTANESSSRTVARNSLAGETTPMKETTNQEIRRSPRLMLKGSPNKSSQKRWHDASPSTSAKRRLDASGESSRATPRCMVNTATVIVGHHHIPHTSIRDIENHPVPYKFRVQVRLMDYKPKVNTARDMLRLYCSKCHYLSPLPESKAAIDSPESWAAKASADDVQDGIPVFRCPTCSKRPQHKSTDYRMLEYIYKFQLLIYDDSGFLLVELVKDEAETFFKDLPARELLRKRQTFQWIQARLRELCPSRGRDKSRPLLEMCIKSYSASNVQLGTNYRAFDTTLASQQDSV